MACVERNPVYGDFVSVGPEIRTVFGGSGNPSIVGGGARAVVVGAIVVGATVVVVAMVVVEARIDVVEDAREELAAAE